MRRVEFDLTELKGVLTEYVQRALESVVSTEEDTGELPSPTVRIDEDKLAALQGILIISVPEKSPAGRAGIKPGMLLLAVGHDNVGQMTAEKASNCITRQGQALTLEVDDNGDTRRFEVKKGESGEFGVIILDVRESFKQNVHLLERYDPEDPKSGHAFFEAFTSQLGIMDEQP